MPPRSGYWAYRVPGAPSELRYSLSPLCEWWLLWAHRNVLPWELPWNKAACPDTLSCSLTQTISKYWLMSMYRDHLSHLRISLQGRPCFWNPWDLPKASCCNCITFQLPYKSNSVSSLPCRFAPESTAQYINFSLRVFLQGPQPKISHNIIFSPTNRMLIFTTVSDLHLKDLEGIFEQST